MNNFFIMKTLDLLFGFVSDEAWGLMAWFIQMKVIIERLDGLNRIA